MSLKALLFGSIKSRLIMICVIPIIIFLAFIFIYLIPSIQEDIYKQKEKQTRQMVYVALSIIENHYNLETVGRLSRAEAQFYAKREVSSLKFGTERHNYYWINDFQPKLLVHPFRPDLEGQDVSDFTDPYGKKIFQEFVEICLRDGSGFVEYHWQYNGDRERIEPKLSYVATFKPWNWIVGAGVYVDDIEGVIAEKRNTALLYALLAISLTLFFTYLVARSSLVIPLQHLSRELENAGEGGNEGMEEEYTDEMNKLFASISKMWETIREREQSLKDSEEKFRYITEYCPLPIAMTNSAGSHEYLNPKFTEVFGYTLSDIPNKKRWFELAYPDIHYREEIIGLWRDDTEKTSPDVLIPRTIRVTCKDGTEKEILFRTALMGNGKILQISEDITERKKNEDMLKEYNEELVAKTTELEELNSQLDQELDKARRVHERTLPKALPEVRGISFASHYQPAQKLGGDFYDVLRKEDKLIFYLSDVSGHGLDGAMLSVFVKHSIKNYVSFTPAHTIKPAHIMRNLLKQYVRESYPEELFVCIFIAILDLKSMELSYCSAGFQDEPLVQLGNGEKTKLTTKGLFITSHLPEELMTFHEEKITLTPGTTIFCNTDGLTEQGNNGTYYMERLPDVFYANAHLPPSQIAQAVLEDFRRFNEGSLQSKDDITFLVLKIEREQAE